MFHSHWEYIGDTHPHLFPEAVLVMQGFKVPPSIGFSCRFSFKKYLIHPSTFFLLGLKIHKIPFLIRKS